MQISCFKRKGWFVLIAALLTFSVYAEEEPCMVFTGNSGESINIPLSTHNRITFGDDSFSVTHSGEMESDEIILSIGDYHHIEFKNAVPSISTIIDEITVETTNKVYYYPEDKTIRVQSNEENEYSLSVYTADGRLMLSGRLTDSRPVSVASLTQGYYIAVATESESTHVIRFIIK